MSSPKDSKGSTDDNKGSSGSKPTPPSDDTGSTAGSTHRKSSSAGHEETGVEKIHHSGGSGGIAVRSGQGYEHLADHQ